MAVTKPVAHPLFFLHLPRLIPFDDVAGPLQNRCQQAPRRSVKIAFGEHLDRICAETGLPLPNPEDAGHEGRSDETPA